jgi:Rieske Fe-S protein
MTHHDGTGCAACPSRRALLAGAGAGLAATLAGCATYGSPAAPAAPGGGDAPGGEATGGDAPAAGAGGAGSGSPAGGDGPGAGGGTAGAVLARVADIPVGGGRIFAERQIVVTQPEAGTVRAFTAVCTHQGCTVAEVKGGTINCPCHGSRFRVADGSVAGGPATRPLAAVRVTVDGGAVRLA